MTIFRRREVVNALVGAAATATLAGPLTAAAQVLEADSESDRKILSEPTFDEFRAFAELSAVLTGIDGFLLAPDSNAQCDGSGHLIPTGADPGQAVKTAYFNLARADASYEHLLKRYDTLRSKHDSDLVSLSGVAQEFLSTDAVGNLARSIIMAWYFGVWYDWKDPLNESTFTVISADAYAQGWIWRIAQTHAPGYSNLRFGHWALKPAAGFNLDALMIKKEASC